MKILAIGDFHGKLNKKLTKTISNFDFDFVFCTGDLADTTERRNIIFKNWEAVQLIGFEEFVGKKRYLKILKKEYETTKKVLRFLNSLNKKVFLVYGNCDLTKKENAPSYIKPIEILSKKYKNIKLLVRKKIKIGNHTLIGHSGYRKLVSRKDKEIPKSLKKLFAKEKNVIFLTHDVPYNTKFDLVRNKSSPMHGKHVGEPIYKEIDLKFKPLLHVFGHMHENHGKAFLGKTLLLNPGAAFENRFALIELNKKIKVRLLKC